MAPSKHIIIIMGVSGVGKTTVGKQVAQRLAAAFFEGDTYHPESNVRQMAAGQPLTDADREPWIVAVAAAVNAMPVERTVVACSALTAQVRSWLREHLAGTCYWVHLTGSPDLIRQRVQERREHFMKADLLASQFATLEAPADALALDVADPAPVLVKQVVAAYKAGTLPHS